MEQIIYTIYQQGLLKNSLVHKSIQHVSVKPQLQSIENFIGYFFLKACLDRLVHKSIRIELNGESLRKKY